jgi:hypothetical protein
MCIRDRFGTEKISTEILTGLKKLPVKIISC